MERGSVVLATAGKEKNQIFVVLKLDKDRAWLVDGKRLKKITRKKRILSI